MIRDVVRRLVEATENALGPYLLKEFDWQAEHQEGGGARPGVQHAHMWKHDETDVWRKVRTMIRALPGKQAQAKLGRGPQEYTVVLAHAAQACVPLEVGSGQPAVWITKATAAGSSWCAIVPCACPFRLLGAQCAAPCD